MSITINEITPWHPKVYSINVKQITPYRVIGHSRQEQLLNVPNGGT